MERDVPIAVACGLTHRKKLRQAFHRIFDVPGTVLEAGSSEMRRTVFHFFEGALRLVGGRQITISRLCNKCSCSPLKSMGEG